MSKGCVTKHVLEKNRNFKEKEKPSQSTISKHFKKIYPLGLHKSNSYLSLSSVSLTLSQSSNESCFTDSVYPLHRKILLPLRRVALPLEKKEVTVAVMTKNEQSCCTLDSGNGELKRCNWITKNSGRLSPVRVLVNDSLITAFTDKLYVQFHDECWGVPVYEDNQLFELLAMSGLLMDYNWTEILKRRELLRENFAGFDPNTVAKMGEKEIMEIASNKALMLAESRVRCIVDNAKCILKVVRECGSFGNYMWGSVDYKPIINRYRYPRNVPLRTPKAEAMSKDLLKRGFRLVGPVIVCSLMQAAGMTIDHLVDCFRFKECVSLAERPWRHV